MIKKKPLNYVDPIEFYEALVKYNNDCDEAEKLGLPTPRIPEYIGKCILDIATRLSNAPRFYRYSWKDDLIGDGIEDCILRIRSFKPERSKAAFAYFTQICWFAFFRRNNKEYKQSTVKAEIIRNSGVLDDMMNGKQGVDDGNHQSNYLGFLLQTIDENAAFREQTTENKGKFIKTTKAHQEKMKKAGKAVEEVVAVKKPKVSKEMKAKLKEAEELEKLMLKDLGEVFAPEELENDNSIDDYYQGIEE